MDELRDVQAMLDGMYQSIESDPQKVLAELTRVVGALVVSVTQQAQVLEKLSEGLDECMQALDEGVFEPFAAHARLNRIAKTKELLGAEGRNFGEFEEFYKMVFDKDLLEEVATKLVDIQDNLEEGAEFDREAWLNEEYSRVKGKYDQLGGLPGLAKEETTVEVETPDGEDKVEEKIDIEEGLSEDAIKAAVARKMADLS